jgi:flagellar biosynthetic protein FliR
MICKPVAINLDIMSVSYILQSITQTLIGFASGTIVNIAFEIFVSAGQIISTQIGLSTASLFDPKYGMITSLTQFYLVVGIIIFLLMNGHLILIDVIVSSFTILPVNQLVLNFLGDAIVSYASIIFTGGVSMAMIILAVILLTNICLAVMSKFAPQFNLFSVGINMSLLIGLVCICATFNIVTDKGADYLGQSLQHMNGYLHKIGK